jgi:hypothetical protein
MTKFAVDTNVAIVANGRSDPQQKITYQSIAECQL